MPLYEYYCRACGHDFEVLVRPPETPRCPKCQSVDLEKLLSDFAVETDERRAAAAKASRERQIRGRKDALVAEEEYRRNHDH